MSHLAIVAALEALDAGDVDYCAAILQGALEDAHSERCYPCPVCGDRFEWPGLLTAHRDRTSH